MFYPTQCSYCSYFHHFVKLITFATLDIMCMLQLGSFIALIYRRCSVIWLKTTYKLSRLLANHVFSGCESVSLTKFTSSTVKALLEDKTKNKKLDTLPTFAHSHSHTHSSTLCNIRAHAGSDKVFALKQYTARNSICLQMESPSRLRAG